MNSLQGLGTWGSNLLGQAQTQLRPAAAAAAELASNSVQRGSNIVRSGAKAVRTSLKENLGSHFGAAHTFEDLGGGGARTVNEMGFIAEGAFGAVVKVADARTGQVYALKKIVCQEGVQVASSLEAAQREAQILRSLPPHPHIVQCFGHSTEACGGGSTVKLLLELCGGGHLLGFMDSKNGSLTPREVLGAFVQIVAAVAHLHAQRPPIQHRDLKVENVLLGDDGAWKLCDFGSCSTERVPAQELSKAELLRLQEEIDKTVTMLYRPPEMADIELNYRKGYSIGERVDIWMLGCILYTMAFYRHPFQDNPTAMAISNAKYFIPEDHPMAKRQKLCGLIHWLLAADPKDRPAAAYLSEVLGDIGNYSYERLEGIMPQAVRDKIQRAQDLFAKRRADDPDIPLPAGLDASASPKPRPQRQQQQPQQQQQQQPRQQSSPLKQHSPAAREPAPSGGVPEGFDIRFALAPEDMVGGPPTPSPAPAPAAAAGFPPSAPAPAPAGPAEDLLSFAAPAAAVSPAAAPGSMGLEDLLGMDGGSYGQASPSRPAAPAAAAAPAPQLAPAGGARGAWCALACSASAPAAAPAQAPAAVGAQLAGFEDFADFASAPPALAPAAAAPPPAAAAAPGLYASPALAGGYPMGNCSPMSAAPAAGGDLFFGAVAADLPHRAASAPAMPFASSPPVAQQAAGAAAKPAVSSAGGAPMDLSAMLSRQADLLG